MKRLTVIVFVLVGTVTLHGQHGGGSDMQASPWWVGLGAGVNAWIGDEEGADVHWNGSHPGFQLGLEIGRWMSPKWGLSLRASTFSLNSPSRSLFGMSALATVTLDWSNFDGEELGGLHIYTPLSAGAAFASDDSSTEGSFVVSSAVGLRYGFGKIDLFGEAGVGVAKFGTFCVMPSFTLGVRFALPSRRVSTYVPSSRSMMLDSEQKEEPRGLVDDMLATNEELHLPVAVVHFAEDESTLDENAYQQLNIFVSQMENADWFTEYYIISTADDAHASQRHNRKLCERRCQEVFDALVDDFEVERYRLLLLPDGGLSEYAHQQSEQMVIVIQRTPETEEVVERWISSY